MIELGEAVGPYTVDALLGEGSVGRVYRVLDRDRRPFAMKVLLHRGQDARARFRREVELLLAMSHPNLVGGVALLDVGEDPALVMEYVDGIQLDQWIAANGAAPVAVRDDLARQLVEGVGYAHARGLVHRDLKPSNLLVEQRGGRLRLVVTDFGLAKGVAATSNTRTGITLGSPRYVAPEQARDAKRVDHRADIWSLGTVLYELYGGRPAFDQPTMLEVLGAVTAGRYRDPAELGVPERIRTAIKGALQVDPAERFPDCRALSVALGLTGDGLVPLLGSPIPSTAVLPRPSQVTLIPPSLPNLEPPPPPSPSPPPIRPMRWGRLVAGAVALAALGGLVGAALSVAVALAILAASR